MQPNSAAQDQKYLNLLIRKIEICKAYKPKLGQGHTTSLDEFKALYSSDPFYSWFGMDNPLLYAAHKAAGGLTSLYRQIGIGSEQLFRQIICDQLGLTQTQASWSYKLPTPSGKSRALSLDGRIDVNDVSELHKRKSVSGWIQEAAEHKGMNTAIANVLNGAVFEVRQGYKSKDSKRQNADIGNAGTALAQGYLPVLVVMSTQIDADIALRYSHAGWLILRGLEQGTPITSTLAFCTQILGYDLERFFSSHSSELSSIVGSVLEALLTPDDTTPANLTEQDLAQLETTDESNTETNEIS